jgi:hypothetical protein
LERDLATLYQQWWGYQIESGGEHRLQNFQVTSIIWLHINNAEWINHLESQTACPSSNSPKRKIRTPAIHERMVPLFLLANWLTSFGWFKVYTFATKFQPRAISSGSVPLVTVYGYWICICKMFIGRWSFRAVVAVL